MIRPRSPTELCVIMSKDYCIPSHFRQSKASQGSPGCKGFFQRHIQMLLITQLSSLLAKSM